MSITDFLNKRIDRLPRGHVFTYTDVLDEVNKTEAVIILALNIRKEYQLLILSQKYTIFVTNSKLLSYEKC